MSIAKPQSLSLVDTITAGYRAINRRPWAMLIPAGVSAYLWVGSPFLISTFGRLGSSVRMAIDLLGDTPQARQDLASRLLGGDVRLSLAWLNLVPVLAPPTLPHSAIMLRGPFQLLGAFALINALSLLWSSLFLTLLGVAVRGERFAPWLAVQRTIQLVTNLSIALLAILGMATVIAIPLVAISALLIACIPAASLPVVLAWYIACFWAYVYAGFMPEAILISHSGPLRSLRNSVNVVRHNLMGALGLLLLRLLIVSGLSVVWHQLAFSPLGVAIAIFGSAYVGSGLSAARLEFYRDQITRWGY
ncbi:MAG: hypothetical protein HGA65_17615 [Oscillochloris sp.]|nr:hypothetical protein [Oscillochloris sp.]